MHKTFTVRILEEIKPTLSIVKKKKYKKIFSQRLYSALFGDTPKDRVSSVIPLSEKDEYLMEVFKMSSEIKESIERIKLSSIFLSKKFSDKKITKIDYMRYHYEYYLNEVYIFYTRIVRLLTFLKKECRNKKLIVEIEHLKIIEKSIRKTLGGFVDRDTGLRSLHVHKQRYTNDKISQINGLVLAASFENDPIFSAYRDSEIRKFKKKIETEINNNVGVLEKIYEEWLYKEIKDIVFKKLIPK
jgi:hypothetical protein